jgi:rhodanese-related sulfurtransferase
MDRATPLSVDELVARVRTRYARLTPAAALAEQVEGAILIDTRTGDAIRRDGSIPGAHQIALSVLPWRADPTCEWADPRLGDRTGRLIVLCQDGFSSSLAVGWLLDLGFGRATDVEGGVTAWIATGLPVERVGDGS